MEIKDEDIEKAVVNGEFYSAQGFIVAKKKRLQAGNHGHHDHTWEITIKLNPESSYMKSLLDYIPHH